jgi:hypothetical protein
MRTNQLLKALKILMLVIAGIVVFGFLTMTLWNGVMPAIFGLKVITFWQALALFALSKVLFGGIHRHAVGRPGWKRHMEARFAQMSPEEREKFRAGMRDSSWCRPRGAAPTTEPTSL